MRVPFSQQFSPSQSIGKRARGSVKKFVVEQIQMAPSPMKVYHPNYAGNNTIDAEDPRSVGSNPLTRPTATLSLWERE